MNTLDAIFTRRSIRKFKKDKISKEDLEEILKAAMHAPSAYNQQPWQFVVIEDRKLLDEISKFHPYAQMCKTAPVAVLVCADLSLEKAKDMWIMDCSAATQNMMLAAVDKDIGSVWMGIHFSKELISEIRKLLNLPKDWAPISLVPLGYPDEIIKKVDRFKKERIHYNSFK
jgi:nitroreductase